MRFVRFLRVFGDRKWVVIHGCPESGQSGAVGGGSAVAALYGRLQAPTIPEGVYMVYVLFWQAQGIPEYRFVELFSGGVTPCLGRGRSTWSANTG